MDQVEASHQWKIATFAVIGGIIGALIGGAATFYGSYWAWNQQQETLNQQEIEEQCNIAVAIYIDISSIENKFNYSINRFSLEMINNTNPLDNPNYIMTTTIQYYDDNGLYYVFGKDISRFDSDTSTDLYEFYSVVEDIENKRKIILAIAGKYLHDENITQYDIITAHEFSKGIYEKKIPYCITLAEKIKKELRQKYNVKIASSPETTINRQSETYNLKGGKMQVSPF